MEREWLEEQLDEGKSLQAIADAVEKHPTTVAYWLRKLGLQAAHARRYAAKGGIPRKTLEDLVGRGLVLRELAASLERSPSTVRYWLKRYGLRTRRAAWKDDPSLKPPYEMRVCGRHGRVRYLKDSRDRYFCPTCRSEAVATRRRRVKQVLVEEAGGCCVLCGYDRYMGALHFHHLDPLEKSFGLALDGSSRSIARAREEARKCVLLCANCHAEVEGRITALPLSAHVGNLPA